MKMPRIIATAVGLIMIAFWAWMMFGDFSWMENGKNLPPLFVLRVVALVFGALFFGIVGGLLGATVYKGTTGQHTWLSYLIGIASALMLYRLSGGNAEQLRRAWFELVMMSASLTFAAAILLYAMSPRRFPLKNSGK